MGAAVFPTDSVESPRFFHEHFTQTDSWILRSDTIKLPEDGTYYLVAFDPNNISGKLWLALGTKEQFGVLDLFLFRGWKNTIQAFHEVGWHAAKPQVPQIPAADLSELPVFEVHRIVDGDTFIVTDKKQQIHIRLIGVDTPETFNPKKPVEHYGKEAGLFLTNLLKGESVYLDITSKDRYGRSLAYAYRYPDGFFINAEIIRQGYGHAYTQFPFEYIDQFRQLEQFAREHQKGLWGISDPNTGEE